MIFVTGGTGLVGSHLLFELVSRGKEVIALKRKSSNLSHVKRVFDYYSNKNQQLFGKINWVEGDILDYDNLESLLSGVDEVYHCAAMVSFNPKERKMMIVNNVDGTANLVDAAISQGVTKFCHVSSIAALGKSENQRSVDETTNWVPSRKESGYAHSKFFAENEVWRGAAHGLEVVIINPSVILGIGDWKGSSGQFFTTVWNGLKYYTKGTTGFVAVKDVAKAMLQLMQEENFATTKNQRYLLNAENLSYKNFFTQIANTLDKSIPSKLAKPWILCIAWRVAKVWSFVTQKEPLLTKEATEAANSTQFYDGSKITRTIDFTYTPISKIINETALQFKADKGSW